VKFMLYNLAGGLIMLAAIIGLYRGHRRPVGHRHLLAPEILAARASGKLDLATPPSGGCSRLLFAFA